MFRRTFVRLACLIHAASVRSEPESISPTNYLNIELFDIAIKSAFLKLLVFRRKPQGLMLNRTIQFSKNMFLMPGTSKSLEAKKPRAESCLLASASQSPRSLRAVL